MSALTGKTAIVTGATGALGRMVSKALTAEGVTIFGLHSGRNQSFDAGSISTERFTLLAADVTNEKSVREVVGTVLRGSEKVDILCHLVGGVTPRRPIEEVPLQEWNDQLSLNATSFFLLLSSLLPQMKQRGSGRIFSIAARPAVQPEAERGAYAVSKAAVVSLTRMAAEELRSFPDISIHCIVPFIIDTAANREWSTPEMRMNWVTPETIAETIIRLCGEKVQKDADPVIQMF